MIFASLPISLNRLGPLDIFLNPLPQPSPNEIALAHITPPPTILSHRHVARLRLQAMQADLDAGHFPDRLWTEDELGDFTPVVLSEGNDMEVAA